MEIHRADKAYRKRALWLLAGITVLCAVLLWLLQAWLQDLTTRLDRVDPQTAKQWVRMLLAGLGIGLSMPAIALGLNLRQIGLASRLQGRFPPAEWKTLRDVRVLRDAAALAWARKVELAGSAVLALAGLLIVWAIWSWWRFS
ncbi:hypothetical protein [Lysobacter fragariae]